MEDPGTPVNGVTTASLIELVARIIVVGILGAFSFLAGAETMRAVENGNFSVRDSLLPIGSTILALVAFRSMVRIFFLSRTGFRQFYAAELALHASNPSILSPVLSRPPSKVSIPMLFVVTGLIGGVVAAIHHFATIRGETTANIMQTCIAAGVTMLSLYGTLVLFSRGTRLGAIILGTGAVAVCIFWMAVAASVAFDQLNFQNAAPTELAAVSLVILAGGTVFASVWAIMKIHGVLKRHTLQHDTDEPAFDDLAE